MRLKKYLLLLLVTAFLSNELMAQTNNAYLKNWQKVNDLETKGQTKSAYKEVLAIYKLALASNNEPQQIKTAMYLVNYRSILEEDSQQDNIYFLDTLIAKAKAPAKNILQSMQAEMYQLFLQNNRFKLYFRTVLDNETSKDISTWSLPKMLATIDRLYSASLADKSSLRKIGLGAFEPIIIKGEKTTGLRPTLYDFLAHRALDYYKTDERGLIQPAVQFNITSDDAFAPAETFIKTAFVSKDSTSLQLKVLQLFQELLQFHLNERSSDAFLDVDLERLEFVYQYAVNSNKMALFEKALQQFESANALNPLSAKAMRMRAEVYHARGQQFNALTNPVFQYETKRAKDLADSAAGKFPGSEGGVKSKNLSNEILNPYLNLNTEQVNVPGQPFRTLVNYRNVQTVYLRIVKMPAMDLKNRNQSDEDNWKMLTALKAVRSWQINLPDPKDYQQHSVEIKIDALPIGEFIILASLNDKFPMDKNVLCQQPVYVSNIGYVANNKNEYYVVDRSSGKPLSNVQAQVWITKYNQSTSADATVKGAVYVTDKNGFFKMDDAKEYWNFTIQFKTPTDELFIRERGYLNYNGTSNRDYPEKPSGFLFTDRSIYRPGQTVYFKGIVLQKKRNALESAVIPSFTSKVILKDVNQQKVTSLTLTTNAFGSYHGAFKLPEGTLNGQFTLYDSNANAYRMVRVEEYKRPKFSVEIKKPTVSYRLGDTVSITGNAKAYAGNPIDGAAVKYRVVRNINHPIWWNTGFRGGKIFPPHNRETTEMTSGILTTQANGDFVIKFKALPDETVDKQDQPIFNYSVSADVTDLNGETRSGETSVAVAYQSIQLDIKLDNKLTIDSLKNIIVTSTNLNGIVEPTTATVTVQALKNPGRIFRQRYWTEPDQFIMSREEYYSAFPFDVYKNENQVLHYQVVDKVYEKKDSTNQPTAFATAGTTFTKGWYKITAVTKDKYGEDVMAEKFVLLTDDRQQTTDEPVTVIKTNKQLSPGETLKYSILTGFDNVWLINTIEKTNDRSNTGFATVTSREPFSATETITEADRGNIGINYIFVKNNRIYNGYEMVEIPWTNKQLDISYSSFRDKLLPGSKEKWSVKVTGKKGEKLAAEMLASMYDASLDQYQNHGWSPLDIWPRLAIIKSWQQAGFIYKSSFDHTDNNFKYIPYNKIYDRLGISSNVKYTPPVPVEPLWWLNPLDYAYSEEPMYYMRSAAPSANGMLSEGLAGRTQDLMAKKEKGFDFDMDSSIKINDDGSITKNIPSADVQIRKNFNETAFFLPDLKTDADGNVSFEFTMPEALTQWKLLTFAHTKDLASGYSEKTTVTQKTLMVQPNAPRFMREGDRLEFTAKVVNLDDKVLTGTAQLELLDAATNQPVDARFKNTLSNQPFTVAAGQSALVKFSIDIPVNFNSALTYRIIAKAGAYSDGEEMAVPVLTNRMLVTETLPINLRKTDSKNFTFTKLATSGNSKTLSNHAITVEYSSNPAWYAVQALPYLMEYPYECAEQTFNRFYANTLASSISNSVPAIRAIFDKWKTADTAALLSNLQKNEELKSALLQETPWVMEAQNEQQQKKNIALLFDMITMAAEATKSINKLKAAQSSNGGFAWFKGGPDDRYITQYIITGIGHLKKLNALTGSENKNLQDVMAMVKKALPYLDQKIKSDYDELIKHKANLKKNNLDDIAIQYLYMRSFFTETPVAGAAKKAFTYYREQSKKFWLNNSKYMQAMIALSLNRTGDAVTPKEILRSLKENAIINEEFGMYWKEWNTGGYYWYQAPVESQALMIEAFSEIEKNTTTVNDLKTWLLKQKQTQNWKTTKATAEACYALLLGGTKWLSEEKTVTVNLGQTVIKSSDEKTEAGTGYFKTTISGEKVDAGMGNISVSVKPLQPTAKPSTATSWGAVYWQYFEDLDKITTAETPLKLSKQLFIERNSDRGPVLESIADGATLKVGDKIKVRIELKADRDMEYVHMKDMRAACMEPVNVLSGYQWQGGLGYYESTKDASTNFFFNWLPRGTYVFEYALFVTHTGNFSNGITNIQCMYAPEFSSHSEGVRVTVE